MEITTELDVKVMPTTIIVDQNLKEISRTIGYFNWSSSKVITQISDLFLIHFLILEALQINLSKPT